LLRNYAVNFVEICNVYIGKMIIKAAKRVFNSDKICRSYSDLNFDVTFLEHSVYKTATDTLSDFNLGMGVVIKPDRDWRCNTSQCHIF